MDYVFKCFYIEIYFDTIKHFNIVNHYFHKITHNFNPPKIFPQYILGFIVVFTHLPSFSEQCLSLSLLAKLITNSLYTCQKDSARRYSIIFQIDLHRQHIFMHTLGRGLKGFTWAFFLPKLRFNTSIPYISQEYFSRAGFFSLLIKQFFKASNFFHLFLSYNLTSFVS